MYQSVGGCSVVLKYSVSTVLVVFMLAILNLGVLVAAYTLQAPFIVDFFLAGGFIVWILCLLFCLMSRITVDEHGVSFSMIRHHSFRWSELENWRLSDSGRSIILTGRDGRIFTLPERMCSGEKRYAVETFFHHHLQKAVSESGGYEELPVILHSPFAKFRAGMIKK